MQNIPELEDMRRFFLTGQTRSYEFRYEQLKRLRSSLLANENAFYESLKQDLKKSPEETWVTELGLVISELNSAIRHLKSWMRPERAGTNLVNLPSRSRIIREPRGVVLVIGPWNYPLYLLFNPIVGAIAAGNCIVMKPSEFTPATNAVMKKVIEDAFAREYIWFVEGSGVAVLPPMLQSFTFDHIFFTGSTAVGREIYKMAADRLVPVTLELGGKSPCIVEEDANLKVAARRIAVTKFSNAGQMCVAPDYVLVHSSRKQELLDHLKTSLHSFFGDDPSESYSYGKIINAKQFDRISAYLDAGKIWVGGKTNREKLYIEPTVLTDVDMHSAIMKDEIFGPVLPVIEFGTGEEARAIIDLNPDPLSFYVYTSSRKKEREWIQNVPAGGTCINNSSWHLTNHHLPFGGRGNSGIGNYHGKYSFETFSHLRAVMKTPTWFDPNLKYPPFRGKLKLFKKFIR